MICQRDGCTNVVPPGRRKYCSEEWSAARRSRLRAQAYRRERLVKYAPRTCLCCGSRFLSEGPWNRICAGCSERNNVYSYARAKGNTLSAADPEDQEFDDRDFELEEASAL